MGEESREPKDEVKVLLFEIARLGFEVGYLGHIEGVGWVRTKLDQLESQAKELGVPDEMREKYELSKELGKKRRAQMSQAPLEIKPHIAPILKLEKLSNTMTIRAPGEERKEMEPFFRIPPEDGISAMANIIKVAEASHWVMRQLDIALCGMADLLDVLGRVRTEGTPDAILTDGLEKLKLTGWITDYRIEEVNAGLKTAKLSAVSAIPNQYGSGTQPICIHISLALESIGARAFRSPVQAIERRCMCQGDEKCDFVITPRQ